MWPDMLWNPAYLGLIGAKPPVNTGKPALASPVWGFDTTVPTLFLADASGTAQPVNGGAVTRVADMFGGGMVMQQSTAANKPNWVTGALSGKAALRFPGSFTHMAASGVNPGALFQSRTFTMLAVYRRASSGYYAGLFAAGNSALGQGNGGFDQVNLETRPQGWPTLYRSGGSDTVSAPLVNPSYADNQTTKVVARSAPANGMEIRLKSSSGSFVGTGPLPSTADSFTWDIAVLGSTLGYQANRVPFATFVGDFFEFSFWNSRASDADFTQLQNYLDLKWGN